MHVIGLGTTRAPTYQRDNNLLNWQVIKNKMFLSKTKSFYQKQKVFHRVQLQAQFFSLYIYINNIVSPLTNHHAHLYADNTVLYYVADSVHLAVKNLHCSFSVLQDALKDLRLVLNADKTKFMLFSRARVIDYDALNISTTNRLMIESHRIYLYSPTWE